MNLRIVFIVLALVGIPVVVYIAFQYGQIPVYTFNQAMEYSEVQEEIEQAKKVEVMAKVIISEQHPFKQAESMFSFYAEDTAGKILPISYTGKDPLPDLKHQQSIIVFGHTHGGGTPYFHATQVIIQ